VSAAAEAPGRLAYADRVRILGAGAVVVQHAAQQGLLRAELPAGDFWLCGAIVASTKWAVPAFVMLSGALLLGRPEPPAGFYARRFWRVGVALLFWSLFYLGLRALGRSYDEGVAGLARRLLAGQPYFHMPFLFVIAGLYAVTPLLWPFVAAAPPAERRRAAGALLAGGFLLEGSMMLLGSAPTAFSRFVPYLGYYLAGDALREAGRSAAALRRAAWLAPAAAGAALLGAGALLRAGSGAWRYPFEYLSPTVIALSLAAFVALQARAPAGGRSSRLAADCAAASLGIYLIHPALLVAMGRLGLSAQTLPPALAVPLVASAAFLASWALTSALRRLPAVRWIVGG
jgi:surface polysaccharide O-acyltransferase-like enzyme